MEKQQANEDRFRLFGSAEMIAFVCECAEDNCKRSVLISPGEFKSRREHEAHFR